MKFKVGDVLTLTDFGRGFDKSTVIDIFEKDGVQYYKLKIMNGTATISQAAEGNYKLYKDK